MMYVITKRRACCMLSILSMLAAGNWATAQEPAPNAEPTVADQPTDRPGVNPRFDLPNGNVANRGLGPVPSKADQRRDRDFRNAQALVGPGTQPPQGGPEGGRPTNPLEMLQQRMRELQRQQEQLCASTKRRRRLG